MILFVGRLITVKGIVNLVKAMQPISEAHPEAKLVVLGSGDLEGTVMSLIKRLGIGNNVSVRFETWMLPKKHVSSITPDFR